MHNCSFRQRNRRIVKRTIMKFIVYCLVITISLHQVQARDDATVKDWSIQRCGLRDIYGPGVAHEKPWWCCKCPAGYFRAGDCRFADPTSTKCEVCPFDPHDSNNQTYTTTTNNLTECKQSFNIAHCDNIRNAHWEAGSITKPSSCVCNDGYHAKPDEVMEYGCNQHSPCEEGYEPVVKGNKTANPRCKPCQAGMFSNVSSSTEMCKHYSTCKEGEVVETNGNATSDTHCSKIRKVKDGTFPYWVIAVAVIFVLAVSVVSYCFWPNGCPCQAAIEIAPGQNPTSSSIARQTSVHVNESFTESDGSGIPLISDKDEANVDTSTEKSNVEIINETYQQTPLETENRSTSRTDEMVIVKETTSKKARTVIDDVLEYCSSLKDNDKAKVLISCTGWKETIRDLVKDSEIGSIIIEGWLGLPCNVLRPIIRIFLTDVEVMDIEDNNPTDKKEVRYQWLYAMRNNFGRELTPEYLLSQHYGGKGFRDSLLHGLVTEAVKKLSP